jgi:hypothetical protein
MTVEIAAELAALDRAIDCEQFERADAILARLRQESDLTEALDLRAAKLAIFRVPEAPSAPIEYGLEPGAARNRLLRLLQRRPKLIIVGSLPLIALAASLSEKLKSYGIHASPLDCFLIVVVVPLMIYLLPIAWRKLRRLRTG